MQTGMQTGMQMEVQMGMQTALRRRAEEARSLAALVTCVAPELNAAAVAAVQLEEGERAPLSAQLATLLPEGLLPEGLLAAPLPRDPDGWEALLAPPERARLRDALRASALPPAAANPSAPPTPPLSVGLYVRLSSPDTLAYPGDVALSPEQRALLGERVFKLISIDADRCGLRLHEGVEFVADIGAVEGLSDEEACSRSRRLSGGEWRLLSPLAHQRWRFGGWVISLDKTLRIEYCKSEETRLFLPLEPEHWCFFLTNRGGEICVFNDAQSYATWPFPSEDWERSEEGLSAYPTFPDGELRRGCLTLRKTGGELFVDGPEARVTLRLVESSNGWWGLHRGEEEKSTIWSESRSIGRQEELPQALKRQLKEV